MPHTTTGVFPAEMLFRRRLKTKLPQYFSVQDNATQKNAQKQHDANKKQKLNFDEIIVVQMLYKHCFFE